MGRGGESSAREGAMKLGLLTAAFPDLSLEQVARWAHENGSEALEIACWPTSGGARRRSAGVSHIDAASFDTRAARQTLTQHDRANAPLAFDHDSRAREE